MNLQKKQQLCSAIHIPCSAVDIVATGDAALRSSKLCLKGLKKGG